MLSFNSCELMSAVDMFRPLDDEILAARNRRRRDTIILPSVLRFRTPDVASILVFFHLLHSLRNVFALVELQ